MGILGTVFRSLVPAALWAAGIAVGVVCSHLFGRPAWSVAAGRMPDEVEAAPSLEGHYALWRWFGCSRASWLTLPRVLMHAMPDEWEGKMAALLQEFDAAFPNWCGDLSFYVQAREAQGNGRLTSVPHELCNYRYPCWDEIDKMRKDPWAVEDEAS